MKDYYAILGVSPDADRETIRTVFRKLCHIYHPDKGLDGVSKERIKDIYEAYEVLSDPEQRTEYDRRYKQAHSQQAGHSGDSEREKQYGRAHTDGFSDRRDQSSGDNQEREHNQNDETAGAEDTDWADESETDEDAQRLMLFRWPEWRYQRYLLIAGIPTGLLLCIFGIAAKVALFALVGIAVGAGAAYAGVNTDWLRRLENVERPVLATGQASVGSTAAILGVAGLWIAISAAIAVLIVAGILAFFWFMFTAMLDG